MNSTKGNALGTLATATAVGIALLLSVTFVPSAIRYAAFSMETKLFPVVGRAILSDPKTVEGGCMFSATAQKYRARSWRQTVVYIGERDGLSVEIEDEPHKGPPKLRGPGVLHWKELFVPIDCDELRATFADTFHERGGPHESLIRSKFWENDSVEMGMPDE